MPNSSPAYCVTACYRAGNEAGKLTATGQREHQYLEKRRGTCLKKYVTDGTAAKGQKCPNCGNETLVYQEGCLICTTCVHPVADKVQASTNVCIGI